MSFLQQVFLQALLVSGLLFGSAAAFGVGEAKAYRVLIVSAEQSGVLATGGLAHATADLAKALTDAGMKADVLMPGYLKAQDGVASETRREGKRFSVELDRKAEGFSRSEDFSLHRLERNGVDTFFLRHEPKDGQGNYFDNILQPGKTTYAPAELEREAFGALAKAEAKFIAEQGAYDIVILNDWHSGLVAPFVQEQRLAGQSTPKMIMAIHNMAYQGRAPPEIVDRLGLNRKFFHPEGFEFYGDVNYLKAGMEYSDLIYTVSPSYAEEIRTARFGQGLEGVVGKKAERYFRVTGILNGIDPAKWDPTKQELAFSIDDLTNKAAGKRAFQRRLGFPVNDRVPVISLTSRIADQKGYAYLIGSLDQVLATRNVQIFQTGDGDPKYIERLKALEKKYPGKFKLEPFSAQAEKAAMAYSDFFLNASWFEPSGLNQFFAMRMGTIPIVSNTGGLKDSVQEGVTGFLAEIKSHDGIHTHNDWTRDEVAKTLNRALDVYENDPQAILRLRKSGMAMDNSWASRTSEFRAMFDYVTEEGPVRLTQARPGVGVPLRRPSDLLRASRGAERPARPSGFCLPEALRPFAN